MSKRELLIAGLIIGILGTLAGFAVLSARAQTRDVTRLAHVREIQMGLELYFQAHSAYPEADESVPLGQALSACLNDDGFTAPCGDSGPAPYVETVPAPPTAGLGEDSSCGNVDNAYCYVGDVEHYRIQFELERGNPALGLTKGLNCATEGGFEPGACEALTDAVE